MIKQRQALQKALEALQWNWGGEPLPTMELEAIEAIKEALVEPEQEPVGIVRTVGGYPDDSTHTVAWLGKYKDLHDGDKLYTSPPTRKPLTDEQIDAAWRSVDYTQPYEDFRIAIARAIERAHGITE